MKATAIIGANFGDEGKGHITNFLSDKDTLNIRFNGGAQAAHSVFMADGRSHIFHQFGSGSMKGARTLFTSHFIVNPMFFVAEWAALHDKTSLREVFVDPRCRVTTPYDMLINEYSCHERGTNDSTGFGINETVTRSQFRQLRISVRDLIDKSEKDLLLILGRIRDEYVPWRLEDSCLSYRGFERYVGERVDTKRQIDDGFIEVIKAMLKFIVVWPDDDLIDKYLQKASDRKLVFEGAQGFRLDQHRKKLLPFLTRSSTGLHNVIDCLRNVKTSIELDVCLVTRSYLTRHGDGPLWNEVKKPYNNIEEPTNVENQYQGKIRYGYLNKTWYDTALEEMQRYINKHRRGTKLYTAFTCLDQLDGDTLIYSNGSKDFISGSIKDFKGVKIISKGVTEKDCAFVN